MPVRRSPACGAIAAFAMISLPALAAEPAGYYLGASVGISKATLDPFREEQRLRGLGLTNPAVTTDERGHAVKAFIGKSLTPILSVEAGIFSLRSYELRGAVAGGVAKTENYVYGYHLDAVAGWPLTESLRLIGRAGIVNAHAKSEFESRGTIPAGAQDSKSVKLGWKFGAGVEYALSAEFSLRGEWERYRLPDGTGTRDYIDALSAGLLYRF